jgi:hypothetical protein
MLHVPLNSSSLDNLLTVCILAGIREWPFAADRDGRGLSVTEYIAIAVCSILLGLIYVASVFLYLHVRRRRREKQQDHRDIQPVHLSGPEEGVVKSNPLLSTNRHPLKTGNYLSDSASCCSDTDAMSDIVPTSDDSNSRVPQNVSGHFLFGIFWLYLSNLIAVHSK